MNHGSFLCKVETAPALRYTANDRTPICEFTVLVPGVRKDAPPSDFPVTVWGERGTEAHAHLKPGMVILVEGETRWDVVERDGYKEKTVTIKANQISSVGKLSGDAAKLVANLPATPPAPQPTPAAPPAPAPVASGGGVGPAPNYDGIPFARLPDF